MQALSRTLGLLQRRLGKNFLFEITDMSFRNPSVILEPPKKDEFSRNYEQGETEYVEAIQQTLSIIQPLLPNGREINIKIARMIAEFEKNLMKKQVWSYAPPNEFNPIPVNVSAKICFKFIR